MAILETTDTAVVKSDNTEHFKCFTLITLLILYNGIDNAIKLWNSNNIVPLKMNPQFIL